MLVSLGVALGAFVVMEPITYLTHRFVMHGPGKFLHRSHHRRKSSVLEWNDVFPVVFAAVVMAGLAIGFNVRGAWMLVPMGVGVTAYGFVYGVVHDVVIHGRVVRNVPQVLASAVRPLRDAHEVHHRFNEEPYGMLFPIVPQRLRDRQRVSGSTPSQVPLDA